jgi:ribosomal-protein-alanine N-acetyltransferase|uniref:Ribosomal-protein-alanine N-acetyltransferase n=1 Tax=Desulfobacca acetoxidans TaxID=60893 RepID=A0A7C3Z336_9BACT
MTAAPFIRRAGLTDVRSIWEIEKLSYASPWSLWCFLAEFANSKSTILVAGPSPPEKWETWGYIIFWLLADEMHILNLAVHPDYRRRGISRALLTAALEQARTQGAEVVWLEVRPSNEAALALYRSFGFREVGIRPGYYTDNGEAALIYAFSWDRDIVAE